MPTIAADTRENIVEFLRASFQVRPGIVCDDETRNTDFENSAIVAQFLSDADAFLYRVRRISGLLRAAYERNRVTAGELVLRGAFTLALRELGPRYGFSDTVVILNGGVEDAVFCEVLRQRFFFRDLLSRKHGEFAHALQWLAIADRFGPAAAGLYSRLGNYLSINKMNRNGAQEHVTLWQWLADCFEGQNENYERNLYARSMRCPQSITDRALPALQDAWIGQFLNARRRKGLDNVVTGHYMNRRKPVMPPEYVERTIADGLGGTTRVYTEHWEHVPDVLVKRVREFKSQA
jgi:hypothetical protein